MSISFAFFTFINAFWLMTFIAIPFCIEYEDNSKKPASEGYAAAPKTIYWKKAITIATVLAALVTLALAVIIG